MVRAGRIRIVVWVVAVGLGAVYASALVVWRGDFQQQLSSGNHAFVAGDMHHLNLDAARRADTSKNGQKPFATILSCSDSRVPVEHVFDQGIGDVFVVRVAGNVAGTSETATVEYGVGHLHTPLLVVMGHKGCGAVAAAAQNADVHGQLPALIARIKPAVDAVKSRGKQLEGAELVTACVSENVRQTMADLIRGSAIIREALKTQQVTMTGALYDIETGKVEWLGPHPEETALMSRFDTKGSDAGSHGGH